MPKAKSENRRDNIFDMVVRSYIETAEPVGSRTISRQYNLGLSPASIRNVMSELEEEGFLKQPHTSAGRIPTDRGYRYWVDTLMEPEEIQPREKAWILEELQKAKTIDDLAEQVSKVISTLTKNAAILYVKNLKRVSFLNHFLDDLVEAHKLGEFFEEEPEIFIEGTLHLIEQPEFQDVQKMRLLVQTFEEKYDFLSIFTKDLEEEGVQVHIGSETPLGELEDLSLVIKDCYLGNVPIGGIAAVGPTRMRYSQVVSIVDYVADSVTEMARRF